MLSALVSINITTAASRKLMTCSRNTCRLHRSTFALAVALPRYESVPSCGLIGACPVFVDLVAFCRVGRSVGEEVRPNARVAHKAQARTSGGNFRKADRQLLLTF